MTIEVFMIVHDETAVDKAVDLLIEWMFEQLHLQQQDAA
jgi:hypothetical protein